MISIVRDWHSQCDGCGKIKDNILVIISPHEYASVSSSSKLCPKCRRELIKRLITLKED